MQQLIGIAILAGIVFAIFAITMIGRWILGPIDRAAKGRRAPARLSVGDFLCLFVAVQLPLAIASRMRSDETATLFWLFALVSWVVGPIVWICCAMSLSRAGLSSGKHRFLFLGLVLPVVYYGLTPFMLYPAVFAASFMEPSEEIPPAAVSPLAYTIWFCTGLALVACGLYTNWLFSQTNAATADTDDLDESADESSSLSSAVGSA
jgi:hypothetical protein